VKVIILIQGRESEFAQFAHLSQVTDDWFFLAWDADLAPVDSNPHFIFYPDSTWAQGRNYLFERAEGIDSFDFVFFLDGDARKYCEDSKRPRDFQISDWHAFFDFLDKHRPTMAVPLTDSICHGALFDPHLGPVQPAVAFDQIFQVYSWSYLMGIARPIYETEHDSLSWWISCEINQCETLTAFPQSSLLWIDFRVVNSHHQLEVSNVDGSSYIGGISDEWNDLARASSRRRLAASGQITSSLYATPTGKPRFRHLKYLQTSPMRLRLLLTASVIKNFLLRGSNNHQT
jgi:hypothetical protein